MTPAVGGSKEVALGSDEAAFADRPIRSAAVLISLALGLSGPSGCLSGIKCPAGSGKFPALKRRT
jgi:hypothetical protein